jgi:hypothetical protein
MVCGITTPLSINRINYHMPKHLLQLEFAAIYLLQLDMNYGIIDVFTVVTRNLIPYINMWRALANH